MCDCVMFYDLVMLVLLSVLNLSTLLKANVLCLLVTTLDLRSIRGSSSSVILDLKSFLSLIEFDYLQVPSTREFDELVLS